MATCEGQLKDALKANASLKQQLAYERGRGGNLSWPRGNTDREKGIMQKQVDELKAKLDEVKSRAKDAMDVAAQRVAHEASSVEKAPFGVSGTERRPSSSAGM